MEIDACASNPCDPHATCARTGPDKKQCACHPGYRGDGETCEEIDGCLSNPCNIHANCTKNGPGTYACDCLPGYQGDGLACTQSDAVLEHLRSHDEHLTAITKLQKRLTMLEALNPHKVREAHQQHDIDTVKESLQSLEKTTEQLIHSSDAQREALVKMLEKHRGPSLLETNLQTARKRNRVEIN
jgi:hypothetical protein